VEENGGEMIDALLLVFKQEAVTKDESTYVLRERLIHICRNQMLLMSPMVL
jgi:hypothetical protein